MGGGSVIGCVLFIVFTIQFGAGESRESSCKINNIYDQNHQVFDNSWVSFAAFRFPDVAMLELSDVLNKNCGCIDYDDRHRPAEGRLQESPWLVLFYYPDEPVHFCHGTLITAKHVLTTAVCASNIVENE